MAELDISQAEADALIAMEKHCAENKKSRLFPEPGGRLSIALVSPDKRENFVLDVTRAQIKLTKATLTERDRPSSSCVLTLMARRTRTPTIQEFHVHTCISTAKGTALNGPSLLLWTDTQI